MPIESKPFQVTQDNDDPDEVPDEGNSKEDGGVDNRESVKRDSVLQKGSIRDSM